MAIYQGIFFHRKKWKKSWYFYWYSFIKNNEKLKKMAFPRKQTVEPSWDEARDRQKCYQLHQHGPARGGIIEALASSLFVDQYRATYYWKSYTSSFDHTTVDIPYPIRTAKSSTVGPNQYCGGGPRGNLGCRMFFLFICNFFLLDFFFIEQLFFFFNWTIFFLYLVGIHHKN